MIIVIVEADCNHAYLSNINKSFAGTQKFLNSCEVTTCNFRMVKIYGLITVPLKILLIAGLHNSVEVLHHSHMPGCNASFCL
jgi:hypothetical protein